LTRVLFRHPVPGDAALPDFAAQCEAMLEAGPPIISSIMGLYPDHFVTRMKANGIKWFATATTVGEAKAAENRHRPL
jgi:nitronate monooxygenase